MKIFSPPPFRHSVGPRRGAAKHVFLASIYWIVVWREILIHSFPDHGERTLCMHIHITTECVMWSLLPYSSYVHWMYMEKEEEQLNRAGMRFQFTCSCCLWSLVILTCSLCFCLDDLHPEDSWLTISSSCCLRICYSATEPKQNQKIKSFFPKPVGLICLKYSFGNVH